MPSGKVFLSLMKTKVFVIITPNDMSQLTIMIFDFGRTSLDSFVLLKKIQLVIGFLFVDIRSLKLDSKEPSINSVPEKGPRELYEP